MEMQELARIGELIRTQDNRITDAPIFIVEEKKRIYGLDPDYCDSCVWVDCEGGEASASESKILDESEDYENDDWIRVGYIDRWEFVTACFTEKGCEEYIKINGHNLKEPRIYAAGSYRNREWRTVRDFLKGLSNVEPKFHIGDHVRKIKGSQWKGHVVGHYATKLTPEGYAVESDTEIGSVQIYPASALEKVQ